MEKLAQIRNPIAGPLDPTESGQSDVSIIENIIVHAIRIFFVLATVFFIFYFIIGAIRWIMSSGDPKQIESARNQIIHSLIGLVILFGLFALLKLIEAIFGVSLLQIDIAPLIIKNP